jgi:GDP-4-dehydro-6-deoxy-D-mannose reductase
MKGSMKKYLITGVSGFVAYHFFEYLASLHDNIEVLGIDNNITEDVLNYNFPIASLSSVEKSWLEPIDSFMNNTNIFLNLVEGIRKNNLKCRLLSIGSSEE